jgi:hypothetical protein
MTVHLPMAAVADVVAHRLTVAVAGADGPRLMAAVAGVNLFQRKISCLCSL